MTRRSCPGSEAGATSTTPIATTTVTLAAEPPGALTANSPGQTDRVAAALAKATAKVPAVPEPEPPTGLSEFASGWPLMWPNKSEAGKLDCTIRETAGKLDEAWNDLPILLKLAQDKAIHVELGYASWTEYVAAVVADEMPNISRDVDARQQVVALMTESGMSQRAIAKAVGVNQATVSRDQQVMHDASPPQTLPGRPWVPAELPAAKVTGLDGKAYTKPQRKREPKPEPDVIDVDVEYDEPADPAVVAQVVDEILDIARAEQKISTWYAGRRWEYANRAELLDAINTGNIHLGTMIATLEQKCYRVGGAVKIPAAEAQELRDELVTLRAALIATLENRIGGDHD